MAASVGGCRQTLIPHHADSFLGTQPPLPTRSSSAAGLDANARQLRTALLFFSLPLRLTLKRETATDLYRVLEVSRGNSALFQTFSMREPVRNVAPSIKEPAGGSVKTFSSLQSTRKTTQSVEGGNSDDVPVWAALLALLQDFIET